MNIQQLVFTPTPRTLAKIMLTAAALILAACAPAAMPPQALADVEAGAYRTLYSVDIDKLVRGATPPLKLVVIDAKITGGKLVHRAFLNGPDRHTTYIGALMRELPDVPLETLFFDLNGTRFAIVWVDESVPGDVRSVTLGRPPQQDNDDSMNVLRTGEAVNRVAVIPIAPAEAHLWQSLADVLVQSNRTGFALEHTYDPPFSIQSLFQPVELP
jgi:hypothetical protein